MIGDWVWLRVYWRSIVFVLFRFVFESSFILGVSVMFCFCYYFFYHARKRRFDRLKMGFGTGDSVEGRRIHAILIHYFNPHGGLQYRQGFSK